MDDESTIRALLHAYAVAVDHQDAAALDRLWAEGGELQVYREGPDRPQTNSFRMPGSVPQFIDALRVYDQSLHMVSTQHVAVDDDSAVGEAYCDAHYILGSNDLVMAVRYDDEFRRIDGAWLFLRRRVNVMWTSERPVTLPA